MRVDCQPGLLGSKTFSQDDQQWFASVSRDFNPMHMDAVAARRLLSGRPVVHGIHTLLLALELWQSNRRSAMAGLACEFGNPVNVGDEAAFHLVSAEEGLTSLLASVDGLSCTRVTIDDDVPAASAHAAVGDAGWHPIDTLGSPLEDSPASQPGRRYELPLVSAEGLAQRFPHAAEAMGPMRLAAIASLSRFVGMVCPGLHSVFSSLRLTLDDEPGASHSLRYTVNKYDDRFRLFTVDFEGCIRGELRAFLRPPPQPQPSLATIAARVTTGEFGGSRTLVIGGSRGLGETVAKIVAAGGGDVIVSHAAGAEDARRVAEEINQHGSGHCTTLSLDLRNASFEGLATSATALDAVYYFATPRIFRKKAELFDRQAFDEFIAFYVDRFAALCLWLEGTAIDRPVKVYLPSTVFIADRPKGLAEYAMAKAAAEVLAEDLNRSLKKVRIVASRLPRLATDQTASVMKLPTESNLDVLLPIVRQVNGRPAGDALP